MRRVTQLLVQFANVEVRSRYARRVRLSGVGSDRDDKNWPRESIAVPFQRMPVADLIYNWIVRCDWRIKVRKIRGRKGHGYKYCSIDQVTDRRYGGASLPKPEAVVGEPCVGTFLFLL